MKKWISQLYDFNHADAGERLLKNTNAANQAKVFRRTIHDCMYTFSDLFIQHVFRVCHSEKAELYSAETRLLRTNKVDCFPPPYSVIQQYYLSMENSQHAV